MISNSLTNFTEVLFHQHKKPLQKIGIFIIEELRKQLVCVLLPTDVCGKLTEAEKRPFKPKICYCYMAVLSSCWTNNYGFRGLEMLDNFLAINALAVRWCYSDSWNAGLSGAVPWAARSHAASDASVAMSSPFIGAYAKQGISHPPCSLRDASGEAAITKERVSSSEGIEGVESKLKLGCHLYC